MKKKKKGKKKKNNCVFYDFYRYRLLQKTMSRLMQALAFSNLSFISKFPTAVAAEPSCLTSSSRRRNVLIVVPS